ncbi:activin receptor type-2A isoform X3, partial [Lates japonicus]
MGSATKLAFSVFLISCSSGESAVTTPVQAGEIQTPTPLSSGAIRPRPRSVHYTSSSSFSSSLGGRARVGERQRLCVPVSLVKLNLVYLQLKKQ